MICHRFLVAAAIACFSFPAAAQESRPVQRQDSASVSAGISGEQLVLEDRLNAIVSQGDQSSGKGYVAEAISNYERALAFVRSQPLLAEQRNRVMEKLAAEYMTGDRARDAVPIYSALLDAVIKDCESQSFALDNCGDAQLNLGVAKLNAGDFSGALTSLREARATYAKAEPFGSSHEFQMIEVKNRAQTDVWIAVALFKLGNTPAAIATIETAIPTFLRLRADESINPGIREDALRLQVEAQIQRSGFEAAQFQSELSAAMLAQTGLHLPQGTRDIMSFIQSQGTSMDCETITVRWISLPGSNAIPSQDARRVSFPQSFTVKGRSPARHDCKENSYRARASTLDQTLKLAIFGTTETGEIRGLHVIGAGGDPRMSISECPELFGGKSTPETRCGEFISPEADIGVVMPLNPALTRLVFFERVYTAPLQWHFERLGSLDLSAR
jgi:tetratricopeptide (TPR) repeat protein